MTVPISTDTKTQHYAREAVTEQAPIDTTNLVGIYKVVRVGTKVVPFAQASAPTGDWRVAALRRGANIDFVSLGGYKNFGGLSDQGSTYSVNMQGATLWRANASSIAPSTEAFPGEWAGVVGASTLPVRFSREPNGILRIENLEPSRSHGGSSHPLKAVWYLERIQ
jgi:hypothetical protein